MAWTLGNDWTQSTLYGTALVELMRGWNERQQATGAQSGDLTTFSVPGSSDMAFPLLASFTNDTPRSDSLYVKGNIVKLQDAIDAALTMKTYTASNGAITKTRWMQGSGSETPYTTTAQLLTGGSYGLTWLDVEDNSIPIMDGFLIQIKEVLDKLVYPEVQLGMSTVVEAQGMGDKSKSRWATPSPQVATTNAQYQSAWDSAITVNEDRGDPAGWNGDPIPQGETNIWATVKLNMNMVPTGIPAWTGNCQLVYSDSFYVGEYFDGTTKDNAPIVWHTDFLVGSVVKSYVVIEGGIHRLDGAQAYSGAVAPLNWHSPTPSSGVQFDAGSATHTVPDTDTIQTLFSDLWDRTVTSSTSTNVGSGFPTVGSNTAPTVIAMNKPADTPLPHLPTGTDSEYDVEFWARYKLAQDDGSGTRSYLDLSSGLVYA